MLSLASLTACAEEAAESAVEGFFEWMMLMVLIAILAFVIWALVLAGGIAALVAGWRRLNRGDKGSGTPPAPGAGAERTHEPGGAPQLPMPPGREDRRGPDPMAILLIVFGGLLVMGAGPIVLFGGDGNSTGGWFNVSVPLPMLIVAGVLVWLGVSRSRRG